MVLRACFSNTRMILVWGRCRRPGLLCRARTGAIGRRRPQHALVWVRLTGTWCRGQITAWIRAGARLGWGCQIVPDSDTPPDDLLRGGRYVYKPAAIRPRYRSEATPAGRARAGRANADASDRGRPARRKAGRGSYPAAARHAAHLIRGSVF